MKYTILDEQIPFSEFFEVRKSRLTFERFDGSTSPEVTRYSFTKWDAVAVLIYHTERDAYLLVRQMRYPPTHQGVDPWMTEIVAGGISPGEDEYNAAMREVLEETGYAPHTLRRVSWFYVSPGIMSERIALYYAEIDETMKVHDGGGLLHEDEDIELIWLPREKVMSWIETQNPGDAKTMLALMWAMLRK